MNKRRYLDLGCLLAMGLFTALWVYPVFSRAHAKAAQAACKSNCEQITLGVLMYAAEHEERLPNLVAWAPALKEYYKAEYILLCPGDTRVPLTDRFSLDASAAVRMGFVSYDMVQRWSYRPRPPLTEAGRSIVLYEVGRQGLDYRHLDGMTIGFLDGHLKKYHRAELSPAQILRGRK